MMPSIEFLVTLSIHHAGYRHTSSTPWDLNAPLPSTVTLGGFFDQQFDHVFHESGSSHSHDSKAMAVCILKSMKFNCTIFVHMRVERTKIYDQISMFSREIVAEITAYLCRTCAQNQKLKSASH